MWILVGILLVSAALNLWGIRWGLPALWYPDEPETIEEIVIPMARNLDPNPHIFHKPSLYYYIIEFFLLPFFLYLKAFRVAITSYPDFVAAVTLVARIVTALSGVAGVYLIYYLGRLIRGTTTGLVAAFLLASNLGWAGTAHFAYMDVPMLVMLLASLCALDIYLKTAQTRYLFWGSLLSGLAISTKFNAAVFVGVALVVAHLMRATRETKSNPLWLARIKTLFSGKLFASAGMVILGFLAGTPFALLDHKTFGSYFVKQLFITKGYKVFETAPSWGQNAVYLRTALGWPLFVLALVSVIWLSVRSFKKARWMDVVILVAPVLYFIYVGSWRITAFRYVLPVVPFLILCTSMAFEDALSRLRSWRIPLAAVLILMAGYTTVMTCQSIRWFGSDTRETATQWMEKYVRKEAQVEVYAYLAYLPRFPNGLQVNRLALDFIPESEQYELYRQGQTTETDSRVETKNSPDLFTREALLERDPDYIVLSSFYFERYIQTDKYPALRDYFRELIGGGSGYREVFRVQNPQMQAFYVNPAIVILKKEGESGSAGGL